MADPEFAELENCVMDCSRAEEEQSADLLGMLRLPRPLISCCDTLCFSLLTLLLLVEVLSAVAVLTVYALHAHWLWLALSGGVFVLTALLTSLVYAAHVRHTHGVLLLLAFFLLNVPAQIAILGHQIMHMFGRCDACCHRETQTNSRKARSDASTWWMFVKLDLIHAVMNCVPQMVITSLFILHHEQIYLVQYVSLTSSFLLLLLAAVLHEKTRKERTRGAAYGCLPLLCVTLYRSLVFAARILAFVLFSLYFGPYIFALLAPRLVLTFAFFVFLYHQVWRVSYLRILLHSLYCTVAYFPVHCDYRPEGEIVLYYITYMLENIVMATLAFVHDPLIPCPDDIKPWSNFHKIATVCVLFCSSAGLIFMGIYYFLFHDAGETIRESKLSWLANICEWTSSDTKAHCNSHTSTFINPVFQCDALVTSRSDQPIRGSVSSADAPLCYPPRELPHNRVSVQYPAIYNETTMDNDVL